MGLVLKEGIYVLHKIIHSNIEANVKLFSSKEYRFEITFLKERNSECF